MNTENIENIAYKFFIPYEIKDQVQSCFRYDLFTPKYMIWSNSQLKELLKRRLQAFSHHETLSSICEPSLKLKIDNEIINFSNGSPRKIIRIGKLIIDELFKISCRKGEYCHQITEESWESVKEKIDPPPPPPPGLFSILFTDIVDSSKRREVYGDFRARDIEIMHKKLLNKAFNQTGNGWQIRVEGDSYLYLFADSVSAIKFALLAQSFHRQEKINEPALPEFRVGIHMGSVIVERDAKNNEIIRDLSGTQVDMTSRIMSMAEGGQILCSCSIAEDAENMLKSLKIPGISSIEWEDHGQYTLKGRKKTIKICEVGETGCTPFTKPVGNEKGKPHN